MKPSSPLHHQAGQLYQQGKYQQTVELLEPELATNEDDGLLWMLLGLARRGLRQFPQALADLETAMTLIPLPAAARCALGDCYARCGKPELARAMLVELAQDARCPAELLPALASSLDRLGEWARALHVCRRASQHYPDHDAPLYAMAYYMQKLCLPPEKILPVMRSAFQLDPQCITYRVSLALIYYQLGQHEEAHRLIEPVPLSSIRCRHCVARLRNIFAAAHDDQGQQQCDARISQLMKTEG